MPDDSYINSPTERVRAALYLRRCGYACELMEEDVEALLNQRDSLKRQIALNPPTGEPTT